MHRRRIKTEEKAKAVAAGWGDRIAAILCYTSYFEYFPPGWFEEKNNGYLAEWMLWKNG